MYPLLSRLVPGIMVFGLAVHRRGLVMKCFQIGIHLNRLIAFQKGGDCSWECNHLTMLLQLDGSSSGARGVFVYVGLVPPVHQQNSFFQKL